MTNEEKPLHVRQAEGLRALADMIEQNPEIAPRFAHTLGYAGISVHLADENRPEQQATLARLALRYGAKVSKDIDEKWHNLYLDFGSVKAHVLAYREEICERVVTGTETVTKSVPDPEKLAEVPMVEITETVEKSEWRCRPLLAAEPDGGAR